MDPASSEAASPPPADDGQCTAPASTVSLDAMDVTQLCRTAASMLGPDEMIHDSDFSLYGAMSALELMDAKMDKPPPVLEVRCLSLPAYLLILGKAGRCSAAPQMGSRSFWPRPRWRRLAQQQQLHPAHTNSIIPTKAYPSYDCRSLQIRNHWCASR